MKKGRVLTFTRWVLKIVTALCEYIYTSNQQTRTVKNFKSVDFFKPVDENPK